MLTNLCYSYIYM